MANVSETCHKFVAEQKKLKKKMRAQNKIKYCCLLSGITLVSQAGPKPQMDATLVQCARITFDSQLFRERSIGYEE